MKLESFKDVKTNQKNDPRFLYQSFFSSFDGRRHRCTIEICRYWCSLCCQTTTKDGASATPEQTKDDTRSDVNPKSFGKDEKVNDLEVTRLVRKTLFWTLWKCDFPFSTYLYRSGYENNVNCTNLRLGVQVLNAMWFCSLLRTKEDNLQ